MERTTLYDRIYACWLGKNIGGTLGAPVEGNKQMMNLTWFPSLDPSGALPNDDLDLQLLNLHVLDQYGDRTDASSFASEWNEHGFFPFDEYGHCTTAMRYGFRPPFSGSFDNHFTDCMGAPIRSEIWGAIFAGQPRMAAYFAQQDSLVDHAGGEGMYGEMFNAALEAAAYGVSGGVPDVPSLIREALTYIPTTCRVSGAVRLWLSLFEKGYTPVEARPVLLERFGRVNFTDAPQNIAFELTGILWCSDFESALLTTVNLGYDTDCTGATCGSLWGILHGREGIPDKWASPIGNTIRMSSAVRGFRPPATLEELTDRCLAYYDHFRTVNPDHYPLSDLTAADISGQTYVLPEGARPEEGIVVDLHYDGDPIVSPDHPHTLHWTLTNHTTWPWTVALSMICPNGLSADDPDGKMSVTVQPGDSVTYSPTVSVREGTPIPDGRIFPLALRVRRMNSEAFWRDYAVPVTLLFPNLWRVNGRLLELPAATLRFPNRSEDGIYTAETVLVTPVSRPTRLFCHTNHAVTVEMDGRTIIDGAETDESLPAYHRVPASRRLDGFLEAGKHRIRVTVRVNPASGHETEPPYFVFGLNALNVTEPGDVFSYIDDVETDTP